MSSQIPKRKFTAADLTPGKEDRLVAAFLDYDGLAHSIGETWRFLAKDFLPYEEWIDALHRARGKNQRVPVAVAGRNSSAHHRQFFRFRGGALSSNFN